MPKYFAACLMSMNQPSPTAWWSSCHVVAAVMYRALYGYSSDAKCVFHGDFTPAHESHMPSMPERSIDVVAVAVSLPCASCASLVTNIADGLVSNALTA